MINLPGPLVFADEFYQTLKKEITPILHRFFQKIKKEAETLLDSFYIL